MTDLNLIPLILIVANTMSHHSHTPALYAVLDQNDVNKKDLKILPTVDSIAIYTDGTKTRVLFAGPADRLDVIELEYFVG